MEGREKRSRSSGSAKAEFNKKCQELIRQMADAGAITLCKSVGELQSEYNSDSLTLEEAQEEMKSIASSFASNKWKNEPGNKPELPPVPALRGRRDKDKEEGKGVDVAAQSRDLFQSAGIDLQEESLALMDTIALSGGQVKNPFRGTDKMPTFCNAKALRELIKCASKAASLGTKVDARVEELVAAAVEARLSSVLALLARAARADEEIFPARSSKTPTVADELRKLAQAEEVEQLRKAKKLKEELEALAAADADDVRVRAMQEEQMRARAAAAASEAAIAMARPKSKSSVVAPAAAEMRVALMKKQEGVTLQPDEEKMLGDYDRRSSSIAAGKKKLEEARQRPERRVGMKELLYVMDSDPYFKSLRMQTSIKAGLLGRGIVGETRVLMRE